MSARPGRTARSETRSSTFGAQRGFFCQCGMFLIALFLALAPLGAKADTNRIALVIGNAAYEHVGSLPNPANDAADIGAALARLGFSVTTKRDLDDNGMRRALRDFGDLAEDADMAVIYFAGHGIEIDNTNYLIPTNAQLKSDRDVEFEAIPLDSVVRAMDSSRGVKIILVDACRNNPFLAEMERTVASRSIGRGLARIDPGGVLVGYSARSGTISLDGEGRNSPYAAALLEFLEEDGLEIGKLFRKVRDSVLSATGGVQEPFTYGSLPGEDIFLAGPAASPTETQNEIEPADKDEAAAAEWRDFRESRSPDALRAFSTRHAGTAYAALAEERAAEIEALAAESGRDTASSRIDDLTELPERLPNWCRNPRNEAERTICASPDLLALDARASLLTGRQLAATSGESKGGALVDLVTWRKVRDTCGVDVACLAREYDLRLIALADFDGESLTGALAIRAVQEQLNRLSCGAGEPDGVVGEQTRSAIRALAAQERSITADADPNSPSLLARLRNLPAGLCSYINIAGNEPEALAGTWDLVATCPEESGWPGETLRYSLTLEAEGPDVYRGRIVRADGWPGTVGARRADGSVNVTIVWKSGSRSSLSLLPGADPGSFAGRDSWRCAISGSKR